MSEKILQQTIFGTEEEQHECCVCKKHIFEGYTHENDSDVYCDKECLHKHMTPQEYDEAYKAGICYWTTFEVVEEAQMTLDVE